MGRHKTISDADVLQVARDVFRAHGHTATTRTIAQAAGISEGVLYQRFGSKDDLFFAAMRPGGPDIAMLLGPAEPPDDALKYLRGVLVRVGHYFAEIIPLALRLMTHPAFDAASLSRAQPIASSVIQKALAVRLASLVRRKRISASSGRRAAQLLVRLAHDWALGAALAPGKHAERERELRGLIDVVWEGLRRR